MNVSKGTLRLTTDEPVDMAVQYCDLVASREGPQLRLKGLVAGEQLRWFGDLEAAEAAMRQGGVLHGPLPAFDPATLDEKRGIEVRLSEKRITLCRRSRGNGVTALEIRPREANAVERARGARALDELAQSHQDVLERVKPLYEMAGQPIGDEALAMTANELFRTRRREGAA